MTTMLENEDRMTEGRQGECMAILDAAHKQYLIAVSTIDAALGTQAFSNGHRNVTASEIALDEVYLRLRSAIKSDYNPRAIVEDGREEAHPVESLPIAIYDWTEASAYQAANKETKLGWNSYAQHEANKFNDNNLMDRSTSTIYQWTPDMTFMEWVKKFGGKPAIS